MLRNEEELLCEGAESGKAHLLLLEFVYVIIIWIIFSYCYLGIWPAILILN
jgi:hypothetical protein